MKTFRDRGPAPGDEIVEAAINGGARKALKRDEAAFQSGRIKIPFPLSVFATSPREGGRAAEPVIKERAGMPRPRPNPKCQRGSWNAASSFAKLLLLVMCFGYECASVITTRQNLDVDSDLRSTERSKQSPQDLIWSGSVEEVK